MNASRLVRDLEGDTHDARYRALSYLAARGGPAIEGRMDDAANLREQAGRVLVWLQADAQQEALVALYGSFCDRWSPVFSY
jgi:hypothetical protein